MHIYFPIFRVNIPRCYEDAMTFRIGAEYQVNPALTVLADLRYDETPIRDEYINPEFIDANRLGVSAGLCYQLTRRLSLEAASSFEYGQQRIARTNPLSAQVANISGSYQIAVRTASAGLAVAFLSVASSSVLFRLFIMMKMYSSSVRVWARLGAACVLLLTARAPSQDTPTPSTGIDARRYVAVGDSYTAGLSNGGLTRASQDYSFPNLLA